MSTKKWYIICTRDNHGKTMYVRKDLNGYTSNIEKAATFDTKREAVKDILEETNVSFDKPIYGKEIPIRFKVEFK